MNMATEQCPFATAENCQQKGAQFGGVRNVDLKTVEGWSCNMYVCRFNVGRSWLLAIHLEAYSAYGGKQQYPLATGLDMFPQTLR
jgi:hypothetical protein